MRVMRFILGLGYICNADKKKKYCCFVLNGRCTFILYAINLFNPATFVCLMSYVVVYIFILKWLFVVLYPRRGRGYTVWPLSVRPSFRQSKIFFVAFFSVTVDGRNLIFGHKLHIGSPYGGKRCSTHHIPTSCLPTLLIFIHIEHICSFFVAFFSATIDGRNLIFGHKLHIGTRYRGKRFVTHQIPTSCLPILLIFIHI